MTDSQVDKLIKDRIKKFSDLMPSSPIENMAIMISKQKDKAIMDALEYYFKLIEQPMPELKDLKGRLEAFTYAQDPERGEEFFIDGTMIIQVLPIVFLDNNNKCRLDVVSIAKEK